MISLKPLLKKREHALFQAYQSVFGGPEGERVLDDLMREAGFLVASTTNDPIALARLEGGRNVIAYVLWRLNWDEAKMRVAAERRVREQEEGLTDD